MIKISAAALLLIGFSAYSDDYLVLFKQAEISVGSMDHEAYTESLQNANEKSITQLKDWLATQRITPHKESKNLWLVRGATLAVETEAAKKLKKEPWIHGVYRDQMRQMVPPQSTTVVGDTLNEVGAEDLWGLERMGLNQIRSEFPHLDGRGISIGILDTGIQGKHPELSGRVKKFRDFVSHIQYEYDDHGHGTHVAGTIAGKKTGFAPRSELLMAKIFGAVGGGQDSAIIEAMQWQFDPDGDPATSDFPRIISNSWGAEIEDRVHDIEEYLPFHLAIQAWINGGIIPIFSAGNSGKSPNGIPGGLPDVIAVGAFDKTDTIAEFSSRGPNLWKIGPSVLTVLKPDISAPGVAIGSSFPGNKYAVWDGTSMAAPHVSGAIALLLQANPKLNFSDVKMLLMNTSEKKGDGLFGYGIMNAYELIKAGLQLRK
ncbi:MAG: hypothetical protein EB078_00610 [Proteobacteria bacterium]|nr:hypothetical protein [Pseudomonadota bacterium]NDC23169.1 hypothetical protein [Pseudomonadota bacterium]NDD03380.1 hypothetical protein [Pseudomonadota bacterium]NDG25616.1 hypothetical protein [Pseudomonadota bacterium]